MDRQNKLAALLGDRLAPDWRQPFAETPRHLFVPDQTECIANGGDRARPIDRHGDEVEWLDAVYSDDIILTQRDPTGLVTSSCSMPYMVFGMLNHLDLGTDMRVLEIGTGTGWNAGLICARVGDDHVVTIEVDPEPANVARTNLAKLGRTPTVITGDGTHGWAPGAPYDRVIATCTVYEIPYSWIEQTRPGGVVLTPWGTPLDNGALLRLVVADDRTASGRFVESSTFMWLRSQQFRAPDEPDDFPETAQRSTATVDLADVFGDDSLFAIGLLVGDCKLGFDRDTDGRILTHWLLAADSWASITVGSGDVSQLGNRRLWDEVEAAYTWWIGQGRPEPQRFGVTVTGAGQVIWLDEQDRVIRHSTTRSWMTPR